MLSLTAVSWHSYSPVYNYQDKQPTGKLLSFPSEPFAGESQVMIRLEGKMLLLCSIQRPKDFKVYTVELKNTVSSLRYFSLGSNILEVPFNYTIEKCSLEELVAYPDYVYLTTSCDNNFRKYFCRCAVERNSKADSDDLRCIKKECFYREYSSTSEYLFGIKLVKRATGRNGDSIYFFNGTAIFLRDFGKSISKDVFKFNDINLLNKKSFIVKGVAFMGKLLHMAVLIPNANPVASTLDMISVSLSRNYYRRINLLKGDYAKSAVEFIAENPSKFSLYQVLVHQPQNASTFLFEDNSILSMKFNLVTADKQLQSGRRRLEQLGDSASSLGDSGNENSPLIVIPVNFSITASGKTNIVSLNLNVLVDENESAELNLPKEFQFYHGSLPLVLPLSKQSIQGYSPKLKVTGKDGRIHNVEYVSRVDSQQSPANLLPEGKIQFYHLDNNLFLLRFNESLKIIEFRANRSEKYSVFAERNSLSMSKESEFFDAISGDDLSVYILVKTSNSSVSLFTINGDGSREFSQPFELPNCKDVLMGAINMFNGAIELDVLMRHTDGKSVELHILNAPLKHIVDKTANFKLYPFLPKNICPKYIQWASRKLPFLYVESNCDGKYTIFEIFLEAVRESEVPLNSFILSSKYRDTSLCAYDKNLMLINREKMIIEGLDRLTEFNPKIRYYPLQEYNLTDVTAFHCDHANPFLGIMGPDVSGKFSKVVLYRVEESGDNSLRRVHSVVKLSKLYSAVAELTIHTDADGIKGYISVIENGSVEQYIFNLAVPSVVIESIGNAAEETLYFSLTVEGSNSSEGNNEEVTSVVKLKLVNQSFASSGYLVGNQPVLKEAEYSLENQFKFDGVFLQAHLELAGKPATTELLSKKNIVSFTDRTENLLFVCDWIWKRFPAAVVLDLSL